MTTETMSIHKALAELKILDGRIKKEIQNGSYCAANKHSIPENPRKYDKKCVPNEF